MKTDEYINRNELLFDLKNSFIPQSTEYTDAMGIAIRWIKEAPAADVVEKGVLKEATDRIEELEADLDDWVRIFEMLNDRENRHKYLDWWRKRYGESELAYPDGDQIYKDFWHLMKIAKAMHLWIFNNTCDEQKAYDECGLSDEDNAMLGYCSFELRVSGEGSGEQE